LLDQTLLPARQIFIETGDYLEVAAAIKRLCVRGAPAIGVAGAYGAALGALQITADTAEIFLHKLEPIIHTLGSTRPTAVNLTWALRRVEDAARRGSNVEEMKDLIVEEAKQIHIHEENATRDMGISGASLIQSGFTVMTHCNAGSLATCGCGTALGVIRAARDQGKEIRVYATETRPLLQGARLTAWELLQEGMDVTLITDSMAGHFLSKGAIDAVIVGADRVAANGDVANKIGTYSIAVLANENGVPFYVAAPLSTIDLSVESGRLIPIEERSHDEVTNMGGVRIAAEGVKVANPAFDVTPSQYVTAIVTENGIIRPPYLTGLKRIFEAGHN